MQSRPLPGTSIERLFAEQARHRFGVVGRRELLDTGVSAQAILRRLKDGTLRELLPGAYALPGAPAIWEQRMMAAQVWARPESCISHKSAAALMRLDGVQPGVVEITTTRSLRAPEGLVVHRTKRLWGYDMMFQDPFTLSTPARTLLELGAVTSAHVVELALEDALRRNLTSLSALRWELRMQGAQGRRGSATLRKLLEERADVTAATGSGLEVRIDRVLRLLPLPPYARQHAIATRNGRRQPDFAFVDYRLAIEGDSYRWHSGRAAWERDKRRDSDLRALGWEIIYVTSEDLRLRRNDFIRDLYAALSRRGWTPPR